MICFMQKKTTKILFANSIKVFIGLIYYWGYWFDLTYCLTFVIIIVLQILSMRRTLCDLCTCVLWNTFSATIIAPYIDILQHKVSILVREKIPKKAQLSWTRVKLRDIVYQDFSSEPLWVCHFSLWSYKWQFILHLLPQPINRKAVKANLFAVFRQVCVFVQYRCAWCHIKLRKPKIYWAIKVESYKTILRQVSSLTQEIDKRNKKVL
jgi:hypothetical protein